MRRTRRKLAVLQVAALGWDFYSQNMAKRKLPAFKKTKSVFPAVTCTTMASVRTGMMPSQHGMIANGLFFRDLKKPMFWEQSSALVQGTRIWESTARYDATRVAMMFWQQSLGEKVDLVVHPSLSEPQPIPLEDDLPCSRSTTGCACNRRAPTLSASCPDTHPKTSSSHDAPRDFTCSCCATMDPLSAATWSRRLMPSGGG